MLQGLTDLLQGKESATIGVRDATFPVSGMRRFSRERVNLLSSKEITMNEIDLTIRQGDAFQLEGDVLVLKYAQGLYGLDEAVVEKLSRFEARVEDRLPLPARYLLLDSHQITRTDKLLFVGVPVLGKFMYKEIRDFSRNALRALAREMPQATRVLMTIHGPGYGLDEQAAFASQLAGLSDGINLGEFPPLLREIVFVERSVGRAERLNEYLEKIAPAKTMHTSTVRGLENLEDETGENLRSAVIESESKKTIFVAMPFAEEFEDVYFFGIQGAVNKAGFLCERADLQSFTGDVVDWVKTRIENATLVVADLTGANANVYLEVGYAWGKNKNTILLVKNADELKFDVKGQRCLVYKNIKDLMEKLEYELKNLIESTQIKN